MILLFILASATFYTGILIKRCMQADPGIRSYPDIGDKAFGTRGRLLISVFMNLELYLVATGFLIMAGDNLHNLLPNVNFEIHGLAIGGHRTFVLLVALVVMPTVWINNMTTLSYVSATGVVASVLILVSILWSGISDIGFHHKGELLNWSGLPTAFSLYAFCYCAHPVFPTLYNSMRNQRQFSSVKFDFLKTLYLHLIQQQKSLTSVLLLLFLQVLLLCFVLCTFTYVSMAILGYLMFGSELKSQITLNLSTDKLSSKVAIYTALINPIAKYALMLRPIVDAIEDRFLSCSKKRFHSLFLRTILLSSSVFVALTVPFFGDLMSLVGAFLSVTASILLPCLCYLTISGAHRRLGFELVFIYFTVFMGVIMFVVGTYTSLVQIFQKL